jgi:hypothetical protein
MGGDDQGGGVQRGLVDQQVEDPAGVGVVERRRRLVGEDYRRPGWRSGATGYDQHHFHVPVRRSTRVRYAAWKPLLPGPGRYRVEAWIPAEHASSRKAAYKVKTTDGWVTRVRNQSRRRGSWVSLGIHELGRRPIVQLADVTGEPVRFGRRLAFDAVRFVPYGVPATAERD